MEVRRSGLSGNRAMDALASVSFLVALLGLIGKLFGPEKLATWSEGSPAMAPVAALAIMIQAMLLLATERFLALSIRVAVQGGGRGIPADIQLTVAKQCLEPLPKYVIRSLSWFGLMVMTGFMVVRMHPAMNFGQWLGQGWLPAPHTMLCLTLLFLASAASTYQQVRSLVVIQMAGLVVVLIALSALVGHLFGTRSPVLMGFAGSGPRVGMALPTALALLCLGGGYLANAGRDFFLAVPVRQFSGFTAVALLLLSMAGLPLLLGWGIAAGALGARFGEDSALALLVVLNVLLQLPIILQVARRLFFQEYELKEVVSQLKEAVARKEELAERLRELSLRDPLTGLANRRALEESLNKAWRRGRRTGGPVSLLYIDVDFFKKYNDLYGHPQGDACLLELASVLKEAAGRETDLPARMGGEEFVLLLSETDLAGAACVAERCHHLLAERAVRHEDSKVARQVTISIGVACLQPTASSTAEQLLLMADQALYTAKEGGRNRTFVAPSQP